MLTGVAGGIGEKLGIHPIYIRAAFLSGMLAGGVGLAGVDVLLETTKNIIFHL